MAKRIISGELFEESWEELDAEAAADEEFVPGEDDEDVA